MNRNVGQPSVTATPAGTETARPPLRASGASWGEPEGSCVQEWTGREWVIVDAAPCTEGFAFRPLDPAELPGGYVGQRVLTSCMAEV